MLLISDHSDSPDQVQVRMAKRKISTCSTDASLSADDEDLDTKKKCDEFEIGRSQNWNLKERTSLLAGLMNRGTYDFEYLADVVGTKTANESRAFVENRCTTIKYEVSKTEKDNLWNQPIAQWLQAIPVNRPFSSHLLIQMFDNIAKSTEQLAQESEPNFKRIYEFLTICLEGGVTPILSPVDSSIVMLLLKRLALKAQDRQDIKAYIPKLQPLSKKKKNQDSAVSNNENKNDKDDNEDLASNNENLTAKISGNSLINPFEIPDSLLTNKS